MKKIFIFLVLIVLLAAAMPVYASHEFVGERLDLNLGKQKFPAGEPFYIMHGWVFDPAYFDPEFIPKLNALGKYGFELEVDGQPVEEDFVYHYALGDPPEEDWPDEKMIIFSSWVYNFPEGMTGTHTFGRHYIWPCGAVLGKEACPDLFAPMEGVDEVVVTFK